jgi:hypothetical protein
VFAERDRIPHARSDIGFAVSSRCNTVNGRSQSGGGSRCASAVRCTSAGGSADSAVAASSTTSGHVAVDRQSAHVEAVRGHNRQVGVVFDG